MQDIIILIQIINILNIIFAVFIKKRTFAPQLTMVPYLSWIEQRPSKAWVLRSNRNGITKKRQVVDKTACLLLFLEGENIQLNGAVESPWGFCLM